MAFQSTASSLKDPDISVYGYDPALRQAMDRTSKVDNIFKPNIRSSLPNPNRNTNSLLQKEVDPNKTSPLLSLPFELRSTILHLLLPHTVPHEPPPKSNPTPQNHHHNKDLIWQRGQTSLLTINRQFYSECAEILYGTDKFVLIIDRGIFFRFYWLIPHSGLMGRRTIALSHLPRAATRIRHWHLLIPHVDSYLGEVFYGKSNRAAIDDHLRGYVETLAGVVAAAAADAVGKEKQPRVSVRVDVDLEDGACSYLEPLRELEGKGLVRLEKDPKGRL